MKTQSPLSNLPLPAVLAGGFGASVSTLMLLGKVIEGPLRGPTRGLDKISDRPGRRGKDTPYQGAMHLASGLGEPWVLYPAAALFSGWALAEAERADATALALSMLGSVGINTVLKRTVRRPRPRFTLPMVGSSGSSFPSQHITMSVATYGAMALMVARHTQSRRLRLRIWAGVLVLCALIGWSRIYLGVHHPSDVLAGSLAGSIWLVACGLARERMQQPQK